MQMKKLVRKWILPDGDFLAIQPGLVAGFSFVVIRAGLEPSITALKGLCPDHLDERTIW